jgi:uncharacterized protein (TIGR00299 family) protein
VSRNGISALRVDVGVAPGQRQHRHLRDIVSIIDGSGLAPRAAERARAIISAVAAAEARVHGTTVERVHFHEVGAVDSIVDIIGTALCLEILDIDRVTTSPVKVGSGGTIGTQHGMMPVPTPATLEILRGYPTVLTDVAAELTTPTGAAIVAALSSGVMDREVVRPAAIGYGAGSRDIPGLPNLLRVVVAEAAGEADADEVVVLEADMDDMNPQLYPVVLEALLASGARDAYLTPVVMKKGRPGIHLTALIPPPLLEVCISVVLRETSTLGVRMHRVVRRTLPREERVVRTSFGPVRVKVVEREGRRTAAPEFEECRRIAAESGRAVRDVQLALERELASMQ